MTIAYAEMAGCISMMPPQKYVTKNERTVNLKNKQRYIIRKI